MDKPTKTYKFRSYHEAIQDPDVYELARKIHIENREAGKVSRADWDRISNSAISSALFILRWESNILRWESN